ncbi:MAG: HtpX-2 peptidase, heat shock protein HtpX [Candidatus Gottesmanbacteria bacterium GW2011_GWA2_43_14]|uniref:Protease HtpX homolog n=1 Tax=Candidatus Gottesmanbacteria bacterium GW2011_GWA2_43_14 TaxID=1618443 RepID=A0A0G1FU45_9BACT|nr:MAG: HtpX-2 peptidase, heat shock protein HtpX [Candidatus Gottesmanbacteria bacterium GW2011_GWA2_43_14]
MNSIHSQIQANKMKTAVVMTFFILFVVTVSFVLGKSLGYGSSWIGMGLIISGLMSFVSFYYSDKIVLSISGARKADRQKDFDLYTVTENMALAAGIPKPKVYVIEDTATNAFATGRDPQHAVVCATRGLINKLSRRELEGVIAHEISHIQNFDIRLMAMVTVMVGVIALLSDWFSRSLWFGRHRDNERNNVSAVLMLISVILALLAPVVATLIQLAISRRREFLADASGALLTRNPDALASALQKISGDREVLEAATNATAHLYIVNPFKGKNFTAWFANLFNTHPPISERVKILEAM